MGTGRFTDTVICRRRFADMAKLRVLTEASYVSTLIRLDNFFTSSLLIISGPNLE